MTGIEWAAVIQRGKHVASPANKRTNLSWAKARD